MNETLTQGAEIKPSQSNTASASLLTSDEQGQWLRFFMTEVFEDATIAPGQLFLFGRVAVGARMESVCVVVSNIPHHLFFLPAKREDGGRFSVAEVKQEIMAGMAGIVRSTQEIGFRVDRKKYAFEVEGIPTEEVLLRQSGHV